MSPAELPVVSIVIAGVNPPEYLEACLRSLAGQHFGAATEWVLVRRAGQEHPLPSHLENVGITPIRVPQKTSLGRMRSIGLRAARADIVALTEDHCLPAPDWLDRLEQAHGNGPAPIIGGPVDNGATSSPVDRAAFLLEYLPFASPLARGPVDRLAAANVSYRSSFLRQHLDPEEAYDAGRFHELARSHGFTLWAEPDARVTHRKHFTLRAYTRERFHFSRCLAGTRFMAPRDPRRAVYALGAPLLPLLIAFRLAALLLEKPVYRRNLAPAAVPCAAGALAWALGEIAGYLAGPGESESFLS